MNTNVSPKRGEIWLIDFNTTIGKEINKTRPAVVISSDLVGKLPIKLVAPITGWQECFKNNIWHIELEVDNTNNLDKKSAIDVLQIRGVDTSRFKKKIGNLSAQILDDINISIASVIEMQ